MSTSAMGQVMLIMREAWTFGDSLKQTFGLEV
jgi:hypothetical protein